MKFSNSKKIDDDGVTWKRLQEVNRLSKASSERFRPEEPTGTLSLEDRLDLIALKRFSKLNQEI